MKLIPLKCPSCAANLELPADRESAFCTYCGTKVLISTAEAGPPVQTLMELADTSFDAGNTKDALPLYTRILEAQPRNSRAWARKAWCTISEATSDDVRVKYKEAEACLHKAAESDDPQLKEIEEIRQKMRPLVVNFCNVVAVKKLQHAELYLAAEGRSPSYVAGIMEALSYANFALEINPRDLTSLKNAIFFMNRIPGSSRDEMKKLTARLSREQAAAKRRF